jgi:hypothetical protein
VLVQQVRVDQARAHLVEDDERQQKNDGIDGPAGAFEVGVAREVQQLAGCVFVLLFLSAGHSQGLPFPVVCFIRARAGDTARVYLRPGKITIARAGRSN